MEVFPSQYGKTQLAKELERGPDLGDDADDDHDEGKEYSTEALRKYQVCKSVISGSEGYLLCDIRILNINKCDIRIKRLFVV